MPIRRFSYGDRITQKEVTQTNTGSILPILKVMKDCFEQYLNLVIANGSPSSDTVKTYRYRASQFLSWCRERELHPALVTKQNILEYRKHLVTGGKTVPTIRLSLISVKHFYTACLTKKLVEDNPVIGVQAPREKREVGGTIKYLTEEELQQVFDSVAPTHKMRGDKIKQLQVLRDRILLGCMALQGCRSIEMHRANIGDIKQSHGQHYFKLDGKNSVRTVILREDIAEEIVEYKKLGRKLQNFHDRSPLIVSLSNRRYGQRLSRSGVFKVVDRYLERCALKYSDIERSFSPHSLRHTAGTLSIQNGSSLREVQDLLGHADPKTTAIYARVLRNQEQNPATKINVKLKKND